MFVDAKHLVFSLCRITDLTLNLENCHPLLAHYLALSNFQHRKIGTVQFTRNLNCKAVETYLFFAGSISNLILFSLDEVIFDKPRWMNVFSLPDDKVLLIEHLEIRVGSEEAVDLLIHWSQNAWSRLEKTNIWILSLKLIVPVEFASIIPVFNLQGAIKTNPLIVYLPN